MRALLISTTFYAVVFALVWSTIRAVRHGPGAPEAAWASLRQFLSAPGVVAVLLLGAGLNTAFMSVAGYVDPLDYLADEVAARQFLKHATMYPHDLSQLGIAELAAPITGRAAISHLPGIAAVLDVVGQPPALANPHPPLLGILLGVPVRVLGLRGSFLFLLFIYLGLLYFCLTAILRELFGTLPPATLAGVMGLVFGWYAVDTSLRAVQPGILILALLSAAWLLLRRGRPWGAGMSIGVAVWIHAFPAFLMLYLLLRSRRAFTASVATVCAIACAIGALAGFQTFKEWAETLRATSDLFVPRLGNVSLAGLISTFSHSAGRDLRGDIVGPAMALTVAAIMAAFLWPWNRDLGSPPRVDIEYAAAVVAMLVASPIAWTRYFPILLLPLAVIVRYCKSGGRWSVPAFLFILLLLTIPDPVLGFWADQVAGGDKSMIRWILMSVPAFGLMIVFLRMLRLDPGLTRGNAARNAEA